MPEKDAMASANQTPGGYRFAPLVTSQQGQANQHKPACFGISFPLSFPSRSGVPLHVVVQPWVPLQRSIFHEILRPLFCRSASFSQSVLMPKTLRSSREHPIRSFSYPPTQPAPPTNSPNITHFGSLVSSMRATNPANKIRLFRKVTATILSLPVLISVSR